MGVRGGWGLAGLKFERDRGKFAVKVSLAIIPDQSYKNISLPQFRFSQSPELTSGLKTTEFGAGRMQDKQIPKTT